MNKKCILCGIEKDLSEYYKHPGMTLGVLGRCKTCHKSEVAKSRASHLEECRAKTAEHGRKYRAEMTPEQRRIKAEKIRAWRARNGRGFAHQEVSKAIRQGALIRPSKCSRCLADHKCIIAHHDDYTRPLDVMWLCPICHKVRHKELSAST